MNEKMINDLIESKKVLKGKIVDYVESDDMMEDEVILSWEDLKVSVKRAELDIVLVKKKLNTWVDNMRYFVIIGYDLETGKIYGSFKAYKEMKKAEVIEELKSGATVEAKVTRIFEWGAYLTYKKTTLVLFNNKWSDDYATIKEYLTCNDTILVKYFNEDERGYIQVEAVDKFKEEKISDISFLKSRDVIIGRVRNVKIDRIYVKVANGLDVLCPIPPEEWYNPEPVVGDLVAVRLTQVHEKELRLRGKIQGKLESEEIEVKAGKLANITYITREEFEKCCETDPEFVYGNIEEKSLNYKKNH